MAGYGALSCAQAVNALANFAERHGIVQWTLGFMSGANAAQMMLGSLRTGCAEMPTAPLVTAAEKLLAARSALDWQKQR